ncbi:MAG: DUF2892 domain-containing protein [Gammaproteobacteria bacterium]|nr:MAG: DUF2892 domain-containing protein [Gammaproteobacteria bacterium]
MSERAFRFILGASLILLLYTDWRPGYFAYLGLLAFEGVTNLRFPYLVTRLRRGTAARRGPLPRDCRLGFEAERMLRMIVLVLLALSWLLFPETLWFLPWFIGFMLFMAGLTNICPMVMALRWIGFC